MKVFWRKRDRKTCRRHISQWASINSGGCNTQFDTTRRTVWSAAPLVPPTGFYRRPRPVTQVFGGSLYRLETFSLFFKVVDKNISSLYGIALVYVCTESGLHKRGISTYTLEGSP